MPAFLACHDRRCVGVARDDARHDGGVRHAQPVDAPNAEPRIYDCHFVIAHLAGADGMVQRLCRTTDKLGDSGVCRNLRAGMQFVAAIRLECLRVRDAAAEADSFHNHTQVLFG